MFLLVEPRRTAQHWFFLAPQLHRTKADFEGFLKQRRYRQIWRVTRTSLGEALLILGVLCPTIGDMVEIMAVTLAWDWGNLSSIWLTVLIGPWPLTGSISFMLVMRLLMSTTQTTLMKVSHSPLLLASSSCTFEDDHWAALDQCKTLGIVNNYSPKWRWLAVDIYRAAKRRGKYPTLATDTEVNSCFSIY